MNFSTMTIAFIFAGVLFTLTIFVLIIFPFIVTLISGACWSDANTELDRLYTLFDQMKSDDLEEIDISFGGCVKGFALGMKAGVAKTVGDTACPQNYHTAMAVVPDTKWFPVLRKTETKSTICKKVPCGEDICIINDIFDNNVITLDGPKKDGTVSYCLTIYKESRNSFRIYSSEGKCVGKFEGFDGGEWGGGGASS